MKVRLNNVRLAFPSLFSPKAFGDSDKATYNASLLFAGKSDPDVLEQVMTGTTKADGTPEMKWEPRKLSAMLLKVAKEKWGAKAEVTLKGLQASDKVCLHNGDAKTQYDGFEGNLYVSASSALKPNVYSATKALLTNDNGEVYGGCYVHAVVDLWPQDNKYGKRINASLLSLIFAADGDSFSAGARASGDEFDDVAAGAMADDLA